MILGIGLVLLFFLPIIESINRALGFNLLLLGSLFVSVPIVLRKKISLDFIDTLWLLILLIFTFSFFHSWSYSRTYIELLRYFAYFLIFITFRRLDNPNKILRLFYIPMVSINSFILSLLSFIYLIPIIQLSPPSSGMNLFYSTFGHNRIADILIFAIPLTIYFSVSVKKSRQMLFILATLFFIATFIFSMGRGAMLSLVLAYLIYSFIIKDRGKFWSNWIRFLVVVITIFLVSGFIYSNLFTQQKEQAKALENFYKPISDDWRWDYLNQAIIGFRLSPIFGTGLDTFRYISKIYQKEQFTWSWYAHNHFLQILTETGIVGGLLFALLILLILVKAYKKILIEKKNLLYDALFISLIASSLQSFIDFNWQFLSIFLLFWMGAALLLPAKKVEKGDINLPRKSKINSFWKLFIFVIFLLFSFKMAVPLNSDLALNKAEKFLEKGRNKKAILVLETAFRLDKANDRIAKKLGGVFSKEEYTWDKAHQWNKKAILLCPLGSLGAIKNDYILYLREASQVLEKDDPFKSYMYLSAAKSFYPFYHQKIEGDKYFESFHSLLSRKNKKEAAIILGSYIKLAKEKTEEVRPSLPKIKFIIKRICDKMFIDNKDRFDMLFICRKK